jgi:uncharacterized protein YndB with AHSA1/START domain
MSPQNDSATASSEQELIITRIFDASRECVFEAWAKPEHLAHRFGPRHCIGPSCEVDFRVGGIFRLCMRSPAGEDFWLHGIYRDIVALERIVCTSALMDDENHPRFEVLHPVTFAEHGGKTRLTLHARAVKIFDPTAAASLDGTEEGWKQTLDRLGEYLAKA